MMRFTLAPEPVTFDKRCRKRGQKWLKKNPDYIRPEPYWTEFEPDLHDAFRGLCAYCVMRVMKAEVDHFIPVALFKREGRHELAYEWSNFRYGEKTLNGRKWKHQLLDPFEVQDDWFELILPSLQLVLTDRVPSDVRSRAELTLKKLGLQDDEVIVRYRAQWFEMYRQGELNLDGLRRVAPLIARAVERDRARGTEWAIRVPTAGGPPATHAPTSATDLVE